MEMFNSDWELSITPVGPGESIGTFRKKKTRVRAPKPSLPPSNSAYTVREVATILGLSTKTVIRKFRAMPGVLNHKEKFGRGVQKRRVRITIPKKILEKYLHDHSITP
jgi:hypothetical protein